MVTGERAFPGTTPGAVFDRILNREPRRARRIDPRIPVELEAVLDRLLAKPPEQRYRSAGELIGRSRRRSRASSRRATRRSSASTTASQPEAAAWPAALARQLVLGGLRAGARCSRR